MSVKEFKLEVAKREAHGKKAIKEIRREGGIPGVYYSHDSKASIPFTITKDEIHEAKKSGAHIFNISVGSKKRNVIFKSVQYHPVTDEILHIDLYGVKMDEVITVKATIHLVGDAEGVKSEGGILNAPTSEIEIQCLPGDIPDAIEVDVTDLKLGDSLQVADINLDEKHKLMSSPEAVVASVTHAMREEEPVATEEDVDVFMDDDAPADASEESSDDANSGDASEGE